jgi:hypothetical protein
MTARFDGTLFDHSYADDDPLVRRLRTLDWPGVDPELRKRCWEDFVLRLDDPEAARRSDSERVPEVTRRSVARRQDFTRRLPQAGARLGDGLAGYASARWNWDRRTVPRVAALSS